jgi:hypothetical protein
MFCAILIWSLGTDAYALAATKDSARRASEQVTIAFFLLCHHIRVPDALRIRQKESISLSFYVPW